MDKSKIALGCDADIFRFGGDIAPVMEQCLINGVNVFDTARGYGKSESFLGQFIRQQGSREGYFLITKGCLPYPFSRVNPRALAHDLEKSLRTLDIGYIDLYLLHRDDPHADLEAIIEVLHSYQASGKIRHYGVSNWTLERVKAFNELAKQKGYDALYCLSNAYSLLPWHKVPWGGCICSTGQEEVLSYCKDNGMMFLSFSPLCRGFLSGKVIASDPSTFDKLDRWSKKAYLCQDNLQRLARIEEIAERAGLSVPSLTIAYLISQGVTPSIGTNNPKRIKTNVEAAQIVLQQEIIEELKRIAKP